MEGVKFELYNPGVNFINCFEPNTDLLGPTLNFYAAKSFSKVGRRAPIVGHRENQFMKSTHGLPLNNSKSIDKYMKLYVKMAGGDMYRGVSKIIVILVLQGGS